MEMVRNVTKTDWAAISIMAHEVGHHLQGHTAESGGSRPPIELEADEYSGWIMYLLGASLQDAQVAMSKIASEQDGPTHPGKFKRLEAVQKGWSNAARKFPRQDKQEKTEEPQTKEPSYNAKCLHTARQLSSQEQDRNGGNTHEFRLYVSGTKEELANIESVTYHLHKSFKNPNITVIEPDGGFELKLTVSGQFEATATIRYKNGTTRQLTRYLDF